jgi:DNA-binding CsgD family transcriptional regulator
LASCRGLDFGQPGLPCLTPKEIEILSWVKEGKTNWEIAQIQDVSERTVKFHVANILQKLGASTRAHAVSIALERGLMAAE